MSKKKIFNSEQEKIDYEIEYKNKARERYRKEKAKNPEEYNKKSHKRFIEWKAKNLDTYQESVRKYQIKNKEIINKRSRDWQKDNKEKAKANLYKFRTLNREHWNELGAKSREKTKDSRLQRRRIRAKERKQIDPIFKMSEAIRASISSSFKRKRGFKKGSKTEEMLGCTIEFFINYILNLYPDKNLSHMDFHRYGYHIDHIIPIDSAKTNDEIAKLCHYTNFQPLWWEDNLKKSNKI